MRTEININDLNGAGYVKAAHTQAIALDAANGMSLKLDNRDTRGLIVTVKNTGAAQKNITVLPTAPHLGATLAVIAVPVGETAMLGELDGQWYGAYGRVDFDFEAGFTGEIAAFRLLDRG